MCTVLIVISFLFLLNISLQTYHFLLLRQFQIKRSSFQTQQNLEGLFISHRSCSTQYMVNLTQYVVGLSLLPVYAGHVPRG